MLAAALRTVPLFAELSDPELDWLCARGEELWLERGAVVLTQGQPAEHFWVVLEGEARFTVALNGHENIFLSHSDGEFFAEAPILMGKPYLGSGHTTRRSRFFRLTAADFWAMLAQMPSTTRMIFSATTERVYLYQSMLQQQEKLAALGRLSAGLAHELNNPAAAASRAAEQLGVAIEEHERLAIQLSGCGISPEQRAELVALRQEALARAASPPFLDPLSRGDYEDTLADWMQERGVAQGWRLAPSFVAAGLDRAWMERLAERIPAAALPDILAWLESSLSSSELIREIGVSAGRISELVQAIKSYTYMDQAPEQEVDLHGGLDSTLVMLHHKLKRGIEVVRSYDPSVPPISAYGGELNQVWTNLIDNAIDAMRGQGRLSVRTACEGDRVLIEIADTGPGIPAEIVPRIWEPFFTTKGIGQGSGLGLDIVYRVVTGRHGGDVQVRSRPGETRFLIWLPLRGRPQASPLAGAIAPAP